MRRALEEVRRLREEREAYRADIGALHDTKAHILVVQDRLENARWEHEILEQRFQRLSGERDALYAKFNAALHDAKQKSGFRGLLLERKLGAAAEEVERQSVTLAEVLVAARQNPAVLGSVERKLGDVVAAKDAAIRELQAELGRVAAAHDRAVDGFERKMGQFGIPHQELGFRPLRSADVLDAALLGRAGAQSAAGGSGGAAGGAGGYNHDGASGVAAGAGSGSGGSSGYAATSSAGVASVGGRGRQ
jgi:hypothetical protein